MCDIQASVGEMPWHGAPAPGFARGSNCCRRAWRAETRRRSRRRPLDGSTQRRLGDALTVGRKNAKAGKRDRTSRRRAIEWLRRREPTGRDESRSLAFPHAKRGAIPTLGGMSSKSRLVAVAGLALLGIVILALRANRPPGPTAAVADGPFRLTISAPAARYESTAEILGVTASLVYEGPDPSVQITHAALGPINFAVAQVDGPHHTTPAWDFACNRSDLGRGDSITKPYFKTGGFNGPKDPDQAWLTAFIGQRGLFLEPGRWTITAIAAFSLGGCVGTPRESQASITVTVDP